MYVFFAIAKIRNAKLSKKNPGEDKTTFDLKHWKTKKYAFIIIYSLLTKL